jgi:hypothetical protein
MQSHAQLPFSERHPDCLKKNVLALEQLSPQVRTEPIGATHNRVLLAGCGHPGIFRNGGSGLYHPVNQSEPALAVPDMLHLDKPVDHLL